MPELTRIPATGISQTLITQIEQGGGPKIANVQIANSSWSALDDTAVDVGGGYIVINGSGFVSGCQVIIGATPATSVTFANSSVLRVQVPASSAGTYVAYVINPDGGTAVGVNALTYSASPSWVTSSTLTTQQADVAISIQLSATDATTYTLQAGSSVPAGTTLASNGLFSGTVTGIEANTTYNFTVVATDAQNQDSPRTFSVTVSAIITDQYFPYTTLLLQGNGSNNATSNTFVDSSTNALTITRNGNPTQGTFSPFSPTGWSNYFDGTGDKLTFSTITFSSDFTAECWVFKTAVDASGYTNIFSDASQNTQLAIDLTTAGSVCAVIAGGVVIGASGTAVTSNQWHHIAWVRQGSTCRIYVNGVQQGTGTSSSSMAIDVIGSFGTGGYEMNGYISNVRLTNACLYPNGTTFTPSTVPLTTTVSSGTVQLLTCQSNRFIDNSSSSKTITRNGDVSVQAFSPFAPTEAWSADTHGGSGYFDRTGDWLSNSSSNVMNLGTGSYTVECWVYPTAVAQQAFLGGTNNTPYFEVDVTGGSMYVRWQTGGIGTTKVTPYAWNHLVWVRSGTAGAAYLNGVREITVTDATNYSSSALAVGGRVDGSTLFGGYISGLRVIHGTALYDPSNSTISVPTSPVTAVSNTQFLLKFTNAGIYDVTTKNNLETLGNATIRTDVKKYGAGSLYFDNNSSTYLLCKNKDMFNFLGSNFTLEFWFYRTSSGTYAGLCGSKTDFKVAISIYNGKIMYGVSSNGSSWNIMTAEGTVGSTTINNNTWYHFALVRNGSSFKGYINGQEDVSVTSSASVVNRSEEYCIGSWYAGLYPWGGYIDDFRLTMGVARYTSNFTPSTEEFAAR